MPYKYNDKNEKHLLINKPLIIIISVSLLGIIAVTSLAIAISYGKVTLDNNSQDRYVVATKEFNKKNYKKAEHLLYQYRSLSLDPKSIYDAALLLGRIYTETENYDKAIDMFSTITNSVYKDADLLYYVGEAYYENNIVDLAIETFENALGVDPNHIPTLLRLGSFYMDNDTPVLAKGYYTSVSKLEESYEASLNLAIIALEEGLIDYAYGILNELVLKERNEYTDKAAVILGDIYINDGDTISATEMYLKSLSSNTANEEFIKRLISIYEKVDNYDGIEYVYKQVLEKDPYNYNALMALGDLYYSQDDYDNAILFYNKLYKLKENPYINETTLYLANTYYEDRNLKDAYKYYKKIIVENEKDSIYIEALEKVATITYEQKEFDLSLKYYQEIVKLEEDNSIFLPRLGELELYYGNKDKGIKLLTESINMSTAKAFPTRTLAIYYEGEGDTLSAIKYYTETLSKYPSDRETIFRLGNIYYKIREYEKSMSLLLISASDDKNTILIREHALKTLSVISEAIRKYDNALLYYGEMINLNPTVENYNLYASYAFRRLDYKDAIEKYEKALSINTKKEISHDLHLGIGKSYLRLEDFENAEYNFRRALEYKKGSIEATDGLRQVRLES